MIKVAPSLLSADFANLSSEINTIDNADYLHVDVMDGIFVPNISIGIPIVKCLKKATAIPLDVHLMITEPQRYIKAFCEAGADIVTIHYESCSEENIKYCLDSIHSFGKKASLSVKPGTNISSVYPFLNMLDMVLIMTVEPGFGGQSFMPEMLSKISELRSFSDIDIEVDGGIDNITAKACVEAGANILVSGSYIFKSVNRKEVISGLLSI